ncbi:MAG: hypothetical protein EXS25_07260 [Pedosphaera sp.]|nr:hypothetical protein [Pedosphaera sp.]
MPVLPTQRYARASLGTLKRVHFIDTTSLDHAPLNISHLRFFGCFVSQRDFSIPSRRSQYSFGYAVVEGLRLFAEGVSAFLNEFSGV